MKIFRSFSLALAVLLVCSLLCACGITRVSVSPVLPTSALDPAPDDSGGTDTSAAEEIPPAARSLPAETGSDGAPSVSAALPAEQAEPEPSPSADPAPAQASGVFFTAPDTLRMSNFMLGSRYVHDGKTLYGSRHDTDGSPYFCRMKFTESTKGMYVRETDRIESGVDVTCLVLSENRLFAVRTECASGASAIVRYTFDADGQPAMTRLYSGTCDYLSLCGERLYFTDGDDHLLSMDTDGGDLKQVVADRSVFFPYLISEDLLLFQDDADGETLHLRRLSTGADLRISSGRTYEYVLSGTDLYYSLVPDETDEYVDMRSHLCKADLSPVLSTGDLSPEAEQLIRTEQSECWKGTRFCINGDRINASNYRNESLSDWNLLSDDEYETGFTSACQYVSGNFEIFYDYDTEGLVSKVLFYEPDVKRASYIELG